ncbi:MAG: transcriptional regulator [Crocinitomicaceae bacterium]|nr:transcriptional regulator [Crocinitomicaceae bacterium]|tara:strand:+ start:292 stop:675 length:384 start_codon:yes stop_codon:yes gene_type:complete
MANRRKTKDYNPFNCGVLHFMNLIGGKWKILIMYAISQEFNRFSKLQRMLPNISKQMLVNQLRELEADGIIERKVFAEVPPRVEYRLTEYGKSMIPVILEMQDWGVKDMRRKGNLEVQEKIVVLEEL